MQAIRMQGGLVKTILEIVAESLPAACNHPRGRLALKTILEIVGFHWRMQAILMEGVFVKTILEIVAEHCQLLASHPHGRWACEDNP